MKSAWKWMAAGLLICAAGPAGAATDVEAEGLMEQVRASMPEVPLEMDAAIRVVDRTGRPLNSIRAKALLTPKENGRTTRTTLYDAFGNTTCEMTVDLGEGEPAFSFAEGDPLVPAPLPDLFAPVEGSEISWMDLSFSYFWWPNPRIVGTEKVANRWECQIIEIECPPRYGGGEAWSHIRLWVAPAYSAVVKGEAWRDGAARKRFEVKSVKKLRQVYMIGDLEVRNLETGARARLKVGRMRMLSPEYTAEEMEEFNAPVDW